MAPARWSRSDTRDEFRRPEYCRHGSIAALETSRRRYRDHFFKRLIEIRWIAIDRVNAVAFDADAADGYAILINRRTARVPTQAQRQTGPLECQHTEAKKTGRHTVARRGENLRPAESVPE